MAYIHLKKGRGGKICDGGEIYCLSDPGEDSNKSELSFVKLDLEEIKKPTPISGCKKNASEDRGKD